MPTAEQQQTKKGLKPRFKVDPAASPMPETRQPERLAPGRHQIGMVGEIISESWARSNRYTRARSSESAPDVLNPVRKQWENVANELRDALSLGRLRIWGRPSKTDLGDWIGERASLRPIDKTYWHKAYFTYLFFADETGRETVHCYADRNTGVPAYTDLQFSRSEVQRLWPRELGVFVESFPNVRVADNPSVHESILGGPDRQKFLALLSADKLSAWARPMQGSNDFVKIPATAWEVHKIDVKLHSGDSIGTDGVHRVHHQSFLRRKSNRESTHYDVAVNRAQMKMVWPDLAFKPDDGAGA